MRPTRRDDNTQARPEPFLPHAHLLPRPYASARPSPRPRGRGGACFVEGAPGGSIVGGFALFLRVPAGVPGGGCGGFVGHGRRPVLEAVPAIPPARRGFCRAAPGEFTRRAFEHG